MAKGPRSDSKHDALQQHGCLHARADEVSDPLFDDREFFDPRDVLQVKYEMLRSVRVDRVPVQRAARAFGFSRPSYYQAQAAFRRAGLLGLMPAKRGPRRAHKLSVPVIAFLREELDRDAALRPTDLARRVVARFGVSIHPRTIERGLSQSKKKRAP